MGIFFMIPSKYRSIDVIFLRLSEEKVSLSLSIRRVPRKIDLQRVSLINVEINPFEARTRKSSSLFLSTVCG